MKSENILESRVIYDYTPFSHLDYPNHLACIVWFSGCNMRCDYCYNPDIVFAKEAQYSYGDILEFLKKRQNLLDGVVLSGGEASLHNLLPFCKKIKELGFKIKLDTNGVNPTLISTLLEERCIDYIALDYKAPPSKFTTITHSKNFESFSQTLNLLIEKNFNFEVRTTLHEDLLSVDDINSIISDLHNRAYRGNYYITPFVETKTIANLQAPSLKIDKSQLLNILPVFFRTT